MRPRRFTVIVMAFLSMCSGLFGGIAAEEYEETSRLSIPWQEFKTLVNLDKDEIVLSLDTFQKLLAQAGIKTTPPHAVKEGNVILSRVEFNKLVDQMTPPPGFDAALPFEYLITKAAYEGEMYDDNTAFTGTFTIHVLKEKGYLKVPLLPQGVALKDVRVNGRQAMVVSEQGYHNVVLAEPGEHTATASFSLKSSLHKGPHEVELAIQQTPITLLRLLMPMADIEVEIPQAQQVLTSERNDTTTVSAVVSPGRAISVRWRKRIDRGEKIPPKLYSEVYYLISIEDDALKIDADITYTILHSEVDGVQLEMPENINVLSVSGEGVGAWQEIEQRDQRLMVIPFTYGKMGIVRLRVTAETPLSETGLGNIFSGIRVLDSVRETGLIGIELNTSAEVVVAESEGLEKVAVQKLPQPLIDKSLKPLMLGFKYLKHPYGLMLDIKKHEKIAVPVATINSANVVTLFTEDGKVVHRLLYQIRNSAKQFLEIQLPQGTDVWSVFVDNQPVESSISAQGKLLVPLIRSRSTDDRLDTFPVEMIFCLVKDRFSPFGSLESSLPAVDLLISQLLWSVYLPNDYSYLHFNSTLEKEEIIRGINLLFRAQRRYDERAMKELPMGAADETGQLDRGVLEKIYKGEGYKSSFRNVPLQEEQIVSQVGAELDFAERLEGLAQQQAPTSVSGGAATGVLPIHIQVPTTGQVYRFAKTIVKTEDPLALMVVYVQSWVGRAVRWLILLAIIVMLYLSRRRIAGILRLIRACYQKHEVGIKKCSQSTMTPFVIFGLFMVSLFVSRFFTLLFLFLFWVSAAHLLVLHRRRKEMENRGIPRAQSGEIPHIEADEQGN